MIEVKKCCSKLEDFRALLDNKFPYKYFSVIFELFFEWVGAKVLNCFELFTVADNFFVIFSSLQVIELKKFSLFLIHI